MIINIIAYLFAPLFIGWLSATVYDRWHTMGENKRGFIAIGLVLLWIAYFWMMVAILGSPGFL